MTSIPELTALDRAELEVNRVLEQIGRIFAAANTSQNGTALAFATRMKQILPVSANNFHNALDELDHQLQLAKSIMRRDLALLNHDPSKQREAVQPEKVETKPNSRSGVPKDEATPNPTSAGQSDALRDDTTSSDTVAPNATSTSQPDAPKDEITSGDTSTNGKADLDSPEHTAGGQERPQDLSTRVQSSKPSDDNDAEMKDLPSAQQQLKVDTDNNNDDPAQKAPDTAFSANADMDSLFNDPLTAGSHGDGQANGSVIDFGDNANDTNDFDFGVFDTDLGSNNQLGLQNYTDSQAEAEPDFSALFGGTTGQDGLMSTDAQTDGQQLARDQDIFNFDEMMDIGMNNDDDNDNNISNNNSNATDGNQPEEHFTIDLS